MAKAEQHKNSMFLCETMATELLYTAGGEWGDTSDAMDNGVKAPMSIWPSYLIPR